MRRTIINNRGQALLELATFGIIALAALGFLIRVGMQANYEQEVRMAAFRRALAAADAVNNLNEQDRADAMAVGYHYIADRQMPDPADGFVGLARNRSEASAFVEWGDHLTFAYETPEARRDARTYRNAPEGRKTQPLFIIRQNEAMKAFRQNDFSNKKFERRGSATSYRTTNRVSGTIAQSGASGRSSSSTTTTTDTVLNTWSGDTVTSTVSGSGSSP